MMEFDHSNPNWANTDAVYSTVEGKEKYSVLTPSGIRYTLCEPSNADGAGTFPQRLSNRKV